MNCSVLLSFIYVLSHASVCHGAFARTPVSTTLLPGQRLRRLNCSSDSADAPVAWRFTSPGSSTSPYIVHFGNVQSSYRSLFQLDNSSPYDLLTTSGNSSAYCGTYQCLESNDIGAVASVSATVGVANSPSCTVYPKSAESTDDVTYTCRVTAECGPIRVSMSLLNNGVTVATKTNSVTWTTSAADVEKTALTCSADASHAGSASTTCPQIEILFAPRNLQLTPRQSTYHPGQRIQCSAEGNPAPSYHWTDLVSGAVIQRDLLVITDSMVSEQSHTFRCTATNFYKGVNHTNSVSITFTVPREATTVAKLALETSQNPRESSLTIIQSTDKDTQFVSTTPGETCIRQSEFDAYKSATIAMFVIAILSIAVNVLLVVCIFRGRPQIGKGKSSAGVDNGADRQSTDRASTGDYSTLNLSSLNTPAVYDSLHASTTS